MTLKLPRLSINWREQPQLFERYWDQISTKIENLTNSTSSFITVNPDSTLSNSRYVTVDSGDFTLTDNGPQQSLNFALSPSGVVAGSYGNPSVTLSFTVDGRGRVSSVTSNALNTSNILEGANLYYTDARARTSLSGSTGIAYTAGSGVISLDLASTRNIDHASVSFSAGTGLTGGGDLTANRSFSIANTAVAPAVYGSVSKLVSFTVNAQGQLTSASEFTQPSFGSTIAVGAATPSGSGAGVTFPSTASLSSDPNTLDDYKEGIWNPVVTAGSGTITAYTASGYYTKIGRQVNCTLVINLTTNGTAASSIIATLPFTAASGPQWVGCGRESTLTGNMLQAIVGSGAGSTTILTYNNAYPGGTGSQLTATISYYI